MRDLNRTASLALLAFMGLAGFTACSSDDDTSSDPSVNPDAAVKTTFTLSVGVPQGNGTRSESPRTRVAEDVAQAQATPVFRGIDNITLIPFGLAGSLNEDAPVLSSSTRLGSNITLPGTNGTAENSFPAVAGSSLYNKVYSDVTLPQGTSAFLFYGKAVDAAVSQGITTDNDKHKYGTLTPAGLTGQPSDITFTPVQVNQMTNIPAKATAIATYLTNIANTSITVGTETVNWSTQDNDNNPLYGLYSQFIQNQSGASNDVLAMLQTLYNTLQTSYNDNAMAKAITNNILTEANVDESGKLTLKDEVAGYPSTIENPIPDGVALVSWSNNAFTVNTFGSTTKGELVTKPADLVYPANLQYYVNTNIRTSNTNQESALTSATDWASTLASNLTAGGQVGVNTQTVALLKKIQYAVGRLDLTLKESQVMNDNEGKPVTGYTGNTSNFPISAIFIGGQRQVKFDFTPLDPSASATQYTIYDNNGPQNWVAATPSATPVVAHSLALETPANEPVRIAVELTNNSGQDFKGANGGIIYNGTKFYLVAQLDPAATTTAQPTGTGATTLNQVFKQDFVTKANLTISQNTNGDNTGYNSGLGAAYNILPDLRNPQLYLGLSVDLEWQNGLTFNVEM